jgi:hypothetical protein
MEEESSLTLNYQVISAPFELFIKYLALTLVNKHVWLKGDTKL